MKRCNQILLLLALLLIFSNCSILNLNDLEEKKAETATIVINLGGANSRSVWPPNDNMLNDINYEIILLCKEETKTLTAKGGNAISISVSGGYWNVIVNAIYDNVRYATGSNGVDVKAGQRNPVNLTMRQISTLTSIAEISQYLSVQTGGNTANNPVSLQAEIDLGVMTAAGSGWRQLLDAIAASNKFVALDLTFCAMNGTVFIPDLTIDLPGKARIVSLVLPDAARSISEGMNQEDSSFRYFHSLKDCTGRTIAQIGKFAFASCISLVSVSFPMTAIIDISAFNRCFNLASVSFPAITSIGYLAFQECTSLLSISIPATTSGIEGSFYACTSLASFDIIGTGPLSTVESGKALVRNNTELLAYPTASDGITLPNITAIGPFALADAGLTSASFPAVISIGRNAFDRCVALTSANFPAVNNIGAFVFSRCASLTSVSFPRAANIAEGAFGECASLASFNLTGTGSLSTIEGAKILVRNNTELLAYPTASGNINLPNITIISSFVFEGCSGLMGVDFPEATEIGFWAFSDCLSLAVVKLPKAAYINRGAFSGCASLNTIELGAAPPKLGEILFGHSSAPQSPQNVTVRFPAGATGYGSAPTDTTTQNWGNAFRGMGWDGSNYLTGEVNSNISLSFVTY